jgi:hypothetical protein
MLTVICGEDVASARKYYNLLKNQYTAKNFDIQYIAPKDIEQVVRGASSSLTLFGQKQVFFVDGLNTYVARIKNEEILTLLKELAKNPELDVVDWEEEKEARALKIAKIGTPKEFKPEKSIFQFLDMCHPGNLSAFLRTLDLLTETQDEGFVYSMLCKHVRTLILARMNSLPKTVQAWQRGKIEAQAKLWDFKKLVQYYEGLAKIDHNLKTSANAYSTKEALQILSCYFLK